MVSWLNNAVFYEIYPPSFKDSNGDGIGDINGMIEKLDYIKETGFNVLWLNPWFDSAYRDGGYDIVDFYKIAPRYGTNADAGRFFEEVHKRGMHIILDLVIGHTAIEHPWFKQSGSLQRNEQSDTYIWSPQLSFRGDPRQEDYYISGWSPRGAFKANFFAVQPAINYGYNKIRHDWEMPYNHPSCVKNREMIKGVMRFWLDLGCDGFRVDMAGSVVKNDPGAKLTCKFWREVRTMFDKDYPEAALVSEWFNPSVSVPAGFHIDFYGRNIFRNDDWMRLTPPTEKIVFAKEDHASLSKWLKEYLANLEATGKYGYLGMFSGNHDVWRLRHYSGLRGIAIKLALLLTMPGCPFVYYGDEIGMRYLPGNETEGSASRGGSRTPMQWDGGKNLGFSTAAKEKLYLPVDDQPDAPTVADALAGKNLLYDAVKKLIALRHSRPALQAKGKLKIIHGLGGRFPLVFERSFRRETILIALNPTGENEVWNIGERRLSPLFEFHTRFENGSLSLDSESCGVYQVL